MIKELKIKQERPGLWMNMNITFENVPTWFGHIRKDLKMNVVFPHGKDETYPCIVWICGGGWGQLDNAAHMPNFVELARAGYVIASVEYRDSNYGKYPNQLEDIKSAVRYLKANASHYNIDKTRFGVMGESAGGHLSALTGLVKGNDVGSNLSETSEVQSVVSYYPPTDFNKLIPFDTDRMITNLVVDTKKETLAAASPITYVRSDAPPFLLIHGTEDTIVPISESEYFYDELKKVGVDVTLTKVMGAEHADLYFFQKEISDEIIEFFNRTLK
jgi:acetyl esterase/lipase